MLLDIRNHEPKIYLRCFVRENRKWTNSGPPKAAGGEKAESGSDTRGKARLGLVIPEKGYSKREANVGPRSHTQPFPTQEECLLLTTGIPTASERGQGSLSLKSVKKSHC